jgi:DNA polymerase
MAKSLTNSELVEVRESAWEYVRYLAELGVETFDGPKARLDQQERSVGTHEQPPTASPSPSRYHTTATVTVSPQLQDMLFVQVEEAVLVPTAKAETLEDIWRDIGECTRCGLCEGRTQVVNTHGSPKARLMFVGEAPGADEDAQGKPFVGRAGQLLTKMIEAMGMRREDVIIGNVNRCRPPGNRQPTLEEAAICRPFLFREIAAIQPDVIVVMGNTALRNLLEIRAGITSVRGQFQDFRGIKVMPTFHPAYLLRDPSKKRETWEDLKKVRDYLERREPTA